MSTGFAETTQVAVPEPDLTPDQLVARAAALRDEVLADAPEAEQRGTYSEALHEAFTDAGIYRCLQPRRFGGYGFGFDTFVRMVAEVARGDMGIAWGMSLAADHAWHVATFFPEQCQAEVFGDGHFLAGFRLLPLGEATPTDGGWRVSGTWPYCSGIPHSTHAMMTAFAPDPENPGERIQLNMIVPKGAYEIVDDWGGGQTLGLGASGSNSVRLDDAFVPEHWAVVNTWKQAEYAPGDTVGYQLHTNPLYSGRTNTFFIGTLAAAPVGAALGALDVYAEMMTTKKTSFPPPMDRVLSGDYQRWFGEATGMAESAEALLVSTAAEWMERGRRWADDGEPFTVADDLRLRLRMSEAVKLACGAVDLICRTAGTSAARSGTRLERINRDIAMLRTHIASQHEVLAGSFTRVHHGMANNSL